uniref:Tetratricopeptide repeat domain 23 like n=1 Tax=Varanus komodoensis TaxID=61221 RepID=A0A8D2INF1_VARKO
ERGKTQAERKKQPATSFPFHNTSAMCVFSVQAHNACRELIRSVALTRIIYGDGHWRLAEALANLAHSYVMLQGLPVQAMHHANSAKNIIFMGKAYPSASADDRGNILSVLVTIYYTLGIHDWVFPDISTGKESYHNLQKSEKFVKELQGSDFRGIPELKVSEKDLLAALGRASLQKNMLDLPAKHFEKAIDIIITSEGKSAPELIDLYLDMARSEQVKKNHEKSIGYLLQVKNLIINMGTWPMNLSLHKHQEAYTVQDQQLCVDDHGLHNLCKVNNSAFLGAEFRLLYFSNECKSWPQNAFIYAQNCFLKALKNE